MTGTSRRRPHPASRPREGGFVLVMVLSTVTVISALLAGFVATTRNEARLTMNAVEQVHLRALVSEGLAHAVFDLLTRNGDRPVPIDGSARTITFDQGTVTIAIRDENGRIDLNKADPDLIAGLVRAVGYGRTDARRIADAVADWRDPDDMRGRDGAEDADYRAEGSAWMAADRPFRAVVELRQVRGVSADLYARLHPFVTVHARDGAVNPMTAPREVLDALPEMRPVDVDAVIRDRGGSDADRERVLDRMAPAAAWLDAVPGPAYAIRVQARRPGGARLTVEAIVWPEPGDGSPFRVLDWREPAMNPEHPERFQ